MKACKNIKTRTEISTDYGEEYWTYNDGKLHLKICVRPGNDYSCGHAVRNFYYD